MKFYVNRRSINHNYIETIDEFKSLPEAHAMAREYELADYSAEYYVSRRPCKAWLES